MKSLIIGFAIFAALTGVLSSCQKELSTENGQVAGLAPVSDSNYLDQIFYLQDIGSGFDTFMTANFYYDNLKRNIRTTMIPVSPDDVNYDYLFSYAGTEMHPSSTTNYQISIEDHDTTIRYHFYDAAGRLVKDSGNQYHHDLFIPVDGRARFVKTYTYTGNMIYADYQSWELPPSPPQSEIEYDTATVDTRGNITNVKHYYLYNGAPYLQHTFNYTFDNRPSPYTKLTSLLSRREIPDGDTFFEDHSFTNMVSSDEFDQGNFTYTFNGAGFPVTATALLNDGTAISTVKVIYKYRVL